MAKRRRLNETQGSCSVQNPVKNKIMRKRKFMELWQQVKQNIREKKAARKHTPESRKILQRRSPDSRARGNPASRTQSGQRRHHEKKNTRKIQ